MMEIYIKDFLKMVTSMERGHTYGLIVQYMREIGLKVKYKGKGFIVNLMVEVMKVIGRII